MVLDSEINYATRHYANKTIHTEKSTSVDSSRVHVHEFSMDVGGGETYAGRSFLHHDSLTMIVDSPKPSGWLISDLSGSKNGECRKLFGSDGNQRKLYTRWKNICPIQQAVVVDRLGLGRLMS